MTAHNRVLRSGHQFQDECTCGWRAYGARDRYEADKDLTWHLDAEWKQERARSAAEKERVRLLTHGQNWDIA